jgi:hypothetical protein
MSEGLNNNFAFASTLYFSSLYIDTHITAASLHDTILYIVHSMNMTATFETRRSKPELVTPSRPTPQETKHLSDIDGLRNHHEYTPVQVSFFHSVNSRLHSL